MQGVQARSTCPFLAETLCYFLLPSSKKMFRVYVSPLPIVGIKLVPPIRKTPRRPSVGHAKASNLIVMPMKKVNDDKQVEDDNSDNEFDEDEECRW